MKRLKILAAALVVVQLLWAGLPFAVFADEQEPSVLLICGDTALQKELLESIQAAGQKAQLVKPYAYTAESLTGVSYMVTTESQPFLDAREAGIFAVAVGEKPEVPPDIQTVLIEDTRATLRLGEHSQSFFERGTMRVITEYTGQPLGELQTGKGTQSPFGVIGEGFAYVPWVPHEGLGRVALSALLSRCFGSEAGSLYLLVNEIYAYSDLSLIMETADAFHDAGIPLILEVTPIYDNLDYPAFERYAYALRYAQTRGATVVLGEPVVRPYEMIREPLDTKMARARKALFDAGIQLRELEPQPLSLSMEELETIQSDTRAFGAFPVNTAVVYPLFESSEALAEAVAAVERKWLDFSAYYPAVSLREDILEQTRPIMEPYAYREKTAASLVKAFGSANVVLIAVVGVSAAVFVLLLALSRRLYRRKFYRNMHTKE
ncbi:hypothetical protein U6B65_06880 [Oscillospiraceae bacterium MB08-C2-2]|nr:hypothetical protein U6B65_06880 [Oscillospiraceae bacterium MB08-C2-2]